MLAEPQAAPRGLPDGVSAKSTERSKRRDDIDGLRAIAVVAVIIFHLDSTWLPAGFVGVDMFFTISGFVVHGSLLRSRESSNRGFLAAFYARRVKRLAPSLLVMLATSGLLLALLVPPATRSLGEYYSSGVWAAVGFANVYMNVIHIIQELKVSGGGGYFAQSANPDGHDLHHNPFMHTWSLGVEEQFYFIFPILFIMAYGSRSRVGPASSIRQTAHEATHTKHGHASPPHSDENKGDEASTAIEMASAAAPATTRAPRSRRAVWVLALSVIASLGIGAGTQEIERLTGRNLELSYLWMPSRLWQIGVGALLSHFNDASFRQWLVDRPVVHAALDCVSITLLALSLIVTLSGRLFPLPYSLLAVGGTLTMMAAGAVTRSYPLCSKCSIRLPVLNACLSHKLLAYIGRLSYPLYLWHWPTNVFFMWTFGFHSTWEKFASTGIALALTLFCYHGIETVAHRWRPKTSCRVFATLLPLTGATIVWLLLLQGPLYGRLFVGVDGPLLATPTWCASQSNVTSRACQCQVCSTAYHRPAGAVESANSSPLPPCFLEAVGVQTEFHESPELMPGGIKCYSQGTSCEKVYANSGHAAARTCVEQGINSCLRDHTYVTPSAGTRTVYVLGDSHAVSLIPALIAAVGDRMRVTNYNAIGFDFEGYFANGTAVPGSELLLASNIVRSLGSACESLSFVDCTELKKLIVDAIWRRLVASLQTGDIVINMLYEAKFNFPLGYVTTTYDLDAYARFITAVQDLVMARNAHLLLVGDWPTMVEAGRDCTERRKVDNCVTSLVDSEDGRVTQSRYTFPVKTQREVHNQVVAKLTALASRPAGRTHFLDFFGLFCWGTECSARIPGTSTIGYYDWDHISQQGASYLAPFIACFMESEGVL